LAKIPKLTFFGPAAGDSGCGGDGGAGADAEADADAGMATGPVATEMIASGQRSKANPTNYSLSAFPTRAGAQASTTFHGFTHSIRGKQYRREMRKALDFRVVTPLKRQQLGSKLVLTTPRPTRPKKEAYTKSDGNNSQVEDPEA